MATNNILYIEDNFHNRRIVRKILEREGYTLYECEDGLEGYEMLREMKPPVVLLDISLPSMDGMEIARRVKEDPELQQIFLIALTASAMQGDRERFLDGGCDDYMSKPFRALDLVEMVKRYSDLAAETGAVLNPHQAETHSASSTADEGEQAAESVVVVDVVLPPAESLAEPVIAASPQEEQPAASFELAPEAAVEEEMSAPVVDEVGLQEEQPAASFELAPEAVVEEEMSAPVVEPEVEAATQGEEPPVVQPEIAAAQVEEPVDEIEQEEDAAVVEVFSEPAAEMPEFSQAPVMDSATPLGQSSEEAVPTHEVENDKLADTAELTLEAEQEQSAWALVTETVELQQMPEEEALLEDEEEDAEDLAVISADAEDEPEPEADESDDPANLRSLRSIDAIRAGIMGVINPEHLKPVDPNSFQDR